MERELPRQRGSRKRRDGDAPTARSRNLMYRLLQDVAQGEVSGMSLRLLRYLVTSGAVVTFLLGIAPSALAGSSLSLAPAPLEFGSVTVGSSLDHAFVLTNTGSVDLTLLTLGISGDSVPGSWSFPAGGVGTCFFSFGVSVAPGATCTINLRFAPISAGSLSVDVNVLASSTSGIASNSGTAHGTGVAPAPPPAAG